MRYNDLSIDNKFEVLRRYISHNVDKRVKVAMGRRERYTVLKISHFFHRCCLDLQPGTAPYARKHATRCFYCEKEFGTGFCGKTLDHFFARKHRRQRRKFQKMVISCWHCNHRKKDLHPNELIAKIKAGKIPDMNDWTIAKIEKVLREAEDQIGPECYYL